jgi:hypothetical protein
MPGERAFHALDYAELARSSEADAFAAKLGYIG